MKRLISGLLALALAALLLPASAEPEQAVFMAVNDRLLALNPASMPVMHEGMVYVPAALFDDAELRTYTAYDREGGVATVYSSEKFLRFDFASGGAVDEKGEVYAFGALRRGAAAYLPAAEVCAFFGFSFYLLEGAAAPVARVISATGMTNEAFLRAASLRIQSTLNEYFASPPPSPSPTPQAGSRGAAYLCFYGVTENTPQILINMVINGCRGCFFLTAGDIRENPDAVRRIIGTGNSIGLLCGEDLAGDWGEASALLREAAKSGTRLVALACAATGELLAEAERLGLVVCAAGEGLEASLPSTEEELIAQAAGAAGRADISLGCSDAMLEALPALLVYLSDNNFAVGLLTEVSASFGEIVYG